MTAQPGRDAVPLRPMRKIFAVAALVASLVVGAASAVSANPGPGNSHACAPGQQGNQDPAFRPGACDN